MTTTNSQTAKPSWFTRFWAIVRYEILWNIRKKLFIGVLILAFVFATLNFVLPAFFDIGQNPYFAITFSAGSITFVLFAIVTGMNSISGEFEKGTIVPLLTKPVSRTMVFLGKLFAMFIVVLITYLTLYAYSLIGGILVYGPQNNLELVPLNFIGDIIATFIWVSIVLTASALSKNTLLTVLITFGLFVALSIGVPVVSVFSDSPGVLNYIPGTGASGTWDIIGGANITVTGNVTINTLTSVSTGTDSIGINLAKLALYPDTDVSFYFSNPLQFNTTEPPRLLYTESMSLIAGRAIGVAFVYIAIFMSIAWIVFKRSQIAE
ncbi:MAG: ABC transporter permease [Candidatus Bathyarchaeota archaeon]|nr:ABC transporter permease [Candidatus Bathyarchaeota archaeon]